MRLLVALLLCGLVSLAPADFAEDEVTSGEEPAGADEMAVLMALEAEKMAKEAVQTAQEAGNMAEDAVMAAGENMEAAEGIEEDEPAGDEEMAENDAKREMGADEMMEDDAKREMRADEMMEEDALANEEEMAEATKRDVAEVDEEALEEDARMAADAEEAGEMARDEMDGEEAESELAEEEAEKRARIPKWRRISRLPFVVSKYIGWRNMTKLWNYGCFCGIRTKGGTPVDDIDKCCQAVKACRGETKACKVPFRWIPYRYKCDKGSCTCTDNAKSCRAKACGCAVKFASCIKTNWSSYDPANRKKCPK